MPSRIAAALLRARPVHSSSLTALFALVARVVAALVLLGVVVISVLAGAAPASAHGFSSVVYADVTSTKPTVVQAKLGLEYDLMLVS
ncbi:HupE/UreJ family protein, partial [Curtobacterium flaccumfaciens]|nr:HupE/UreJ family protein [Curtobacterium flaccumfaciens]